MLLVTCVTVRIQISYWYRGLFVCALGMISICIAGVEYIASHYDVCFVSHLSNIRSFRNLPEHIFSVAMRYLPLCNINNAAFAITYPITHPLPSQLIHVLKSAYENRNKRDCDFTICGKFMFIVS